MTTMAFTIDPNSLAGQALLVLALLLIIASLLMGIRKRRRADHERLTPQEQIERNRKLRGMHGQLERLMVEIEEMARQLSSQLDAKAIRLEKLLNDAELKIAQLEQLQQEVAGRQERATSVVGAAEADTTTRQVYELADQGLSPTDIAHRLDEHPGKVELILALREA